jgi:dTDP-4-amino-4,6-dideoxygalactose transaminase
MKVPLLDLTAQWRSIEKEAMRAIKDVCRSQSFILGPYVEAFEREVENYLGIKHAIGVASGSDALLLSLMALGIGPGDYVITSPFTFFATAGSIFRLGSIPAFVDIDPKSFNINPSRMEEYLRNNASKKRIKAVIPVHLFGQCAPMKDIIDIARRYDLWVIEDAAQAFGAQYLMRSTKKGKASNEKGEIMKAGTIGHMGCFSFFPSKNLGAFGDGGMIVTNDRNLAEKIRTLRVHGGKPKYHHKVVGTNSRLDAIQAAILSVKLKYLEKWIEKRIHNAEVYKRLFSRTRLVSDGLIVLPEVIEKINNPHIQTGPGNQGPPYLHIFNQYVIRAKKRDNLRKFLKQRGIETEIYYPLPLHLQECFKCLGYGKGDLPEAEKAAREVIAIPIYPELKRSQQVYITKNVEEFYR